MTAPVPPPVHVLAGRRVLVVEDNPSSLELTTIVLERAGAVVLTAGTAAEGIARALAELPDLVLMDLGLPGPGGLAALKTLKADARVARIPVLAVTAYAMEGDRNKAMDAGADGYITKPISTRSFAQEIARHLVRRPGP